MDFYLFSFVFIDHYQLYVDLPKMYLVSLKSTFLLIIFSFSFIIKAKKLDIG